MKVMPHRQYKVMIDGIRRITLGNRKFFKKIFPVVGDPTYKPKVHNSLHQLLNQHLHQGLQIPRSCRHHPLSMHLVRGHLSLSELLHSLSSMEGTHTSNCPHAPHKKQFINF